MFLKKLQKEEVLNTISHAFGIVFGLIGLVILLLKNQNETFLSTLSIWIYGLSFVALYSASTVYHSVSCENRKVKARKFDHISIYLLIAGTYSPICLITLEKTSGWLLFIVIWSIALAGFILKLFFTGKFEKLSLLLYLTMGWLAIFEYKQLFNLLLPKALFYLILGGVLYTIGVFFYASKRIPYSHFIWHLFVLGGSVSHFMMIYSIL